MDHGPWTMATLGAPTRRKSGRADGSPRLTLTCAMPCHVISCDVHQCATKCSSPDLALGLVDEFCKFHWPIGTGATVALWPLWPKWALWVRKWCHPQDESLEHGCSARSLHQSPERRRRRLSLAAQNLLKLHETRDRDNSQDIGQYNLYNHVYNLYNLLSTIINQRALFEETHR
jgi:hypothetical protein